MSLFLHAIKSLLVMSTIIATVAHANLPNDVYTGYWAMSQKVLGEHIVVEFKKQNNNSTLATVHHFECLPNGHRMTQRTQTVLIPTSGAMAVYETGKSAPTSHLKVYHYTPKQKLFLTQTFTEQLTGLRQTFPDGMIILYYPTTTLTPICTPPQS